MRDWLQASNFAFKITAKPLQIETWLLLTAIVIALSTGIGLPSPTPFGVRFSHTICVTHDNDNDDV